MPLSSGAIAQAGVISPARTTASAMTNTRMLAIDALRGLVMLIMLIDHVRETFFLHVAVTDPADAFNTSPDLFFTRMTSQLCAPVFIFLTGLSAWLYSQKHTAKETSLFLLKRGLFLVLLEVTIICFAWNAELPPKIIWLQVIWCIGICMIVLAGLLHFKRSWLIVLGVVLIAGHNLMDGIVLTPDSPFFVPWAILHQRGFIELTDYTRARTSYPVLPWIGVIVMGWAIGPWFGKDVEPSVRSARLLKTGLGLLVAFVFIRYLNVYGEKPWVQSDDALRTFMSFMSATKYPPSLMFLLQTLPLGLILLALFEKIQDRWITATLAIFGGAPMFFYILHLYLLKGMYLIALAIWGANQGKYYGFDTLAGIWMWSVILWFVMFYPTRWYANLKQRRRDIAWLKYL